MIREYKTIEEINGPLMVVRQVEGVTYDELGEIELPDGTTRRCKVLEVNGDNAVVQLFEASAGINLAELFAVPAREKIGRAKSVPADQYKTTYEAIQDEMEQELAAIAEKGEDAL